MAKGVLVSDVFVETKGTEMQAGWVGQTAGKVREKIDAATGGMLFIDEAYALASTRGSFAEEAMNTLVGAMEEDRHKGRTVVVLAGYPKEMEDMFTTANPGLASRFKQRIDFPDWDASDAVEYLKRRSPPRDGRSPTPLRARCSRG